MWYDMNMISGTIDIEERASLAGATVIGRRSKRKQHGERRKEPGRGSREQKRITLLTVRSPPLLVTGGAVRGTSATTMKG